MKVGIKHGGLDSQGGRLVLLGGLSLGVLGRLDPLAISLDHRGVASNLSDKVEEVTVSVRAISGKSLIPSVEMRGRSVQTLNGKLAEAEIRRPRRREFLKQETL
jgi:hypothetical protein